MSGGAFNYLQQHGFPEREDDLRRMAQFLRDHGMYDAAAATEAFLIKPSDELRNLWRAADYHVSGDFGFDQVMDAYNTWNPPAEEPSESS